MQWECLTHGAKGDSRKAAIAHALYAAILSPKYPCRGMGKGGERHG